MVVHLPLLIGLTAFASVNLGSSELGAASMVAGKERRRSGRRHRSMDFSIRRGSLPFLTPGYTNRSTGQASEAVELQCVTGPGLHFAWRLASDIQYEDTRVIVYV